MYQSNCGWVKKKKKKDFSPLQVCNLNLEPAESPWAARIFCRCCLWHITWLSSPKHPPASCFLLTESQKEISISPFWRQENKLFFELPVLDRIIVAEESLNRKKRNISWKSCLQIINVCTLKKHTRKKVSLNQNCILRKTCLSLLCSQPCAAPLKPFPTR